MVALHTIFLGRREPDTTNHPQARLRPEYVSHGWGMSGDWGRKVPSLLSSWLWLRCFALSSGQVVDTCVMDEGRAPPADVAEAAVPQGTMSDYCLPHLNSVPPRVATTLSISYRG